MSGPSDPPPRSPVEVRLEATVHAPPGRVWAVLSRISAWSAWHPGIDFARLRGDLAEGTRLDWRADGMRIRSVVREAEPPQCLGLSLRMLGGTGYQRWTLDRVDGDRTRIVLEEAWEGLLVRMLRGTLRRTLVASRTVWVETLVRRSADPANEPR